MPPIVLERGIDIRTVYQLLGNKGLATTMIYQPLVEKGPSGRASPLTLLDGLTPEGVQATLAASSYLAVV